MGWELPIHPRSGRIHTSNQPTFVLDETGDVDLDACRFVDGFTKELHLGFVVPGSYASGNGTLTFRWRTGATGAGNVARCSASQMMSYGNNAAGTNIAVAEASFTADATTNEITESTLSSGMTIAAYNFVCANFTRVGGSVSDTLSDNFDLDLLSFSGTANPDYTRTGFWAGARSLIPGGTATRGSASAGLGQSGTCFPAAIILQGDETTSYAEFSFTVPSNYGGSGFYVLPYHIMDTGGGSQQCVFRVDHVAVQAGESWDQALSSGTQYTRTANSHSNISIGTSTAAVNPVHITGSFASGDRVTIRFNRLSGDASDTNSNDVCLLGILVEFGIITKNPQTLILDPVSGALPVGSTAEVNVVSGTNQTLPIALMPDNEDHYLHLRGRIPDTYESGGTLTIDWVSETTGNWYMGLDYSSPAPASDPDPALTNVAAAAKASSGAGVVTRTTFTVSTDLTDNDHFNLRIYHNGAHASHTCGYVRIIGARLTFSVEDPA